MLLGRIDWGSTVVIINLKVNCDKVRQVNEKYRSYPTEQCLLACIFPFYLIVLIKLYMEL